MVSRQALREVFFNAHRCSSVCSVCPVQGTDSSGMWSSLYSLAWQTKMGDVCIRCAEIQLDFIRNAQIVLDFRCQIVLDVQRCHLCIVGIRNGQILLEMLRLCQILGVRSWQMCRDVICAQLVLEMVRFSQKCRVFFDVQCNLLLRFGQIPICCYSDVMSQSCIVTLDPMLSPSLLTLKQAIRQKYTLEYISNNSYQ